MNEDTGGIIFWLFVGGVAFLVYWIGGINVVWYAIEFRVSPNKVHVYNKPQDCNFLSAPLGEKGCHYVASVSAFNAVGVLVGGDDAPLYGHDRQTGKPILSYDQGKHWGWLLNGEVVPDPRIQNIEVSSRKVND